MPGRKASLSKSTLAWKPAEWRKPAQHFLQKLWAQRACDQGACDCLKDNRSISIIWCTERIWKRRSPSSDYWRSKGIWRNWDTQLTGLPAHRFKNIRDVLFPIAHALRRFCGKHCRFLSRRWRVTKDADFTTVCPESFRETWSGVLCSETLIRRILEDLFLQETRITWSIKQDQTWRSKSFMSSPSTSAAVNYNDKRKSKDWRYRTHNTDLLSPDDNKFDYKKNCLWRKKVLRKTRNPKYARNGRN